MYSLLIIIFIFICAMMTFIILIQSSKGGGLAGTFGGSGGSMSTIFGGQGSAPFLTKITAVLATLFMLIALILGMITRGNVDQQSLVEREREQMMTSPARTLPQATPPPGEGSPAPSQ